MNTYDVQSWSLEPTFIKLTLVDRALPEHIAVALDIPMATLSDLLRAHDCATICYTNFPVLAHRPQAQMVLNAIVGVVDAPPQLNVPDIIDDHGLSLVRVFIQSLLSTRSPVLHAELTKIRNSSGSRAIRQSLNDLDVTVASFARLLEISRTSLYAYMRSYDILDFEAIPSRIRAIFDHIANTPNLTKQELGIILTRQFMLDRSSVFHTCDVAGGSNK